MFLKTKQVDLVDVKNALVSTVNGTWFDSVMSRCFHSTRLEGIVTDIAQERTGKSCSCIHERWHVFASMLNQYLWNSAFITGTKTATDKHVTKHEQKSTKQERENVTVLDCGNDKKETNRSESD